MHPPTPITAVITGAAGGLGRALAETLYRQGCHLALLDVQEAGLQALHASLTGSSGKVTVHTVDVADEAAMQAAAQDIREQHGAVHWLINNAAVSISQYFEQLDPENHRRLMDINFWGTVYGTRYFLPLIRQQPDGRIVNIISDFALMGFPGKTAYAASKGAVLSFTQCLKTELAGTGIRVCLVIPPPMDTGIVRQGLHMSEEKRAQEAAFLKEKGMPADKAARLIIRGIQAGRFRIVVGPMMYLLDTASRLFPTWLHGLIGRYRKKIDFV